MRLKIKKNGRSHGHIKLVHATDSLGNPDWFADTQRSKVFKEINGWPEHAVKTWLTARDYQYTLVYR